MTGLSHPVTSLVLMNSSTCLSPDLLIGPTLGTGLLVAARPLVAAGADDDEVLALLVALRSALATKTWTDQEGDSHPFSVAVLARISGGNCNDANGDLASHLGAEGFDMSLVDLVRRSFESHTVAQARLTGLAVVVDVAFAQFDAAAPWPLLADRSQYLDLTGFRVVGEEPVRVSRPTLTAVPTRRTLVSATATLPRAGGH